jgi:putative PIN family toxin of toxin-antitoxin system
MLDTNIFISMIFFPSTQTRELAKRLTDNHQIIVCDYVIAELRLVTDRKFPAKREFLDRFFLELPFTLVYTPKVLNLSEFPEVRDRKDSPILATAIMEEVDVFVTGDKDFLVLDVDMPEILTMTEFLRQY